MPVGDAEDKARYAEYHRNCERIAQLEERAITAGTEWERRQAAEAAKQLRLRNLHLFA